MGMKFGISADEWYPVYELETGLEYTDTVVELTDVEYADYQRVLAEFNAWQDRLKKIVDGKGWSR